MKIVADANIPLLAEAFGPLGEVTALPADALVPEAVRDADALLVRSVTRVGPALLDGSRVRFVATATIGVDHVDQPYLESRGIGFASAQGSNARSVAEWVLAALSVLARRRGTSLTRQTLGIVGCGNVGGRLATMAEGLGLRVILNDPPLARKTGDPKYRPLDELADADAVTFHVPLERGGQDPTFHLLGEALLARLKSGATVLNSSRGAVADSAALAAAIDGGRLGPVVLDVWEGEPNVDPALLRRTALATPHVAGYSYDGKVNGTRMCLEALCGHFGVACAWNPSPLMPPAARPEVTLEAGLALDAAVTAAIGAAYDIEADDARMRRLADLPDAERAAYFKSLRKNYPVRREFPETAIRAPGASARALAALKRLGFPVLAPAG